MVFVRECEETGFVLDNLRCVVYGKRTVRSDETLQGVKEAVQRSSRKSVSCTKTHYTIF